MKTAVRPSVGKEQARRFFKELNQNFKLGLSRKIARTSRIIIIIIHTTGSNYYSYDRFSLFFIRQVAIIIHTTGSHYYSYAGSHYYSYDRFPLLFIRQVPIMIHTTGSHYFS
jgi:hypothetical protein